MKSKLKTVNYFYKQLKTLTHLEYAQARGFLPSYQNIFSVGVQKLARPVKQQFDIDIDSLPYTSVSLCNKFPYNNKSMLYHLPFDLEFYFLIVITQKLVISVHIDRTYLFYLKGK